MCGLGFEAFVPKSWIFRQMWFLTYILFCYCSIPIVQRIPVKKMTAAAFWGMLMGATLILQSVGFVVGRLTRIPLLSWGQLLRFYFPYFIIRKYAIESKELKKIMSVMTSLSCVCIAGVAYVRYGMRVSDRVAPLVELCFIYTLTLAGTALFYWLYKFFSRMKIIRKLLVLSDRYSYPIYLTHGFFVGYELSLIDNIPNRFIGVIAALICTMIASMALDAAVRKIKGWLSPVK